MSQGNILRAAVKITDGPSEHIVFNKNFFKWDESKLALDKQGYSFSLERGSPVIKTNFE